MKNHHLEAKDLRFSVFSSADLRKLSVAKVITPLVFDPLGHALPGGLYDPKMGKKIKNFKWKNFAKQFLFFRRSIFDQLRSMCNMLQNANMQRTYGTY